VDAVGDLDFVGTYRRKGDAMTDLEQRLRDEAGRLTRALQDASHQRKVMQAELNWYLDDITEAIELLQAGSGRAAILVLQGSLNRRTQNTRER
jgi:hypothetical protein